MSKLDNIVFLNDFIDNVLPFSSPLLFQLNRGTMNKRWLQSKINVMYSIPNFPPQLFSDEQQMILFPDISFFTFDYGYSFVYFLHLLSFSKYTHIHEIYLVFKINHLYKIQQITPLRYNNYFPNFDPALLQREEANILSLGEKHTPTNAESDPNKKDKSSYFKFDEESSLLTAPLSEQYVQMIVRSQMEKEKGYQVTKN